MEQQPSNKEIMECEYNHEENLKMEQEYKEKRMKHVLHAEFYGTEKEFEDLQVKINNLEARVTMNESFELEEYKGTKNKDYVGKWVKINGKWFPPTMIKEKK